MCTLKYRERVVLDWKNIEYETERKENFLVIRILDLEQII